MRGHAPSNRGTPDRHTGDMHRHGVRGGGGSGRQRGAARGVHPGGRWSRGAGPCRCGAPRGGAGGSAPARPAPAEWAGSGAAGGRVRRRRRVGRRAGGPPARSAADGLCGSATAGGRGGRRIGANGGGGSEAVRPAARLFPTHGDEGGASGSGGGRRRRRRDVFLFLLRLYRTSCLFFIPLVRDVSKRRS